MLTNGGKFKDPSVIRNTWEIFMIEVRGETSTTDLGGGMIGAVLFALFHYLFADTGTKIIAFIFILIGVILLTGKSFGDFVAKIMMVFVDFSKSQWDAFKTDMTEWKQKQQEKKAERTTQRRQEQEHREQNRQTRSTTEPQSPQEEISSPEPIINNWLW